MTHLPSLGEGAVLLDVFRRFPHTSAPLLDYHQVLLRGPSPLTVAQRELIAAYVCALNACDYCARVHAATAVAFGVDEEVVTALVVDVDSAPVDAAMKPVLQLARTLTLTPARVRGDEVAGVYAAGWDERALHDAVSVCALFNFMNRLVEGLASSPPRSTSRRPRVGMAGAAGHAGLRDMLTAPPAQAGPHAPLNSWRVNTATVAVPAATRARATNPTAGWSAYAANGRSRRKGDHDIRSAIIQIPKSTP